MDAVNRAMTGKDKKNRLTDDELARIPEEAP
jgi:hypothetical protein